MSLDEDLKGLRDQVMRTVELGQRVLTVREELRAKLDKAEKVIREAKLCYRPCTSTTVDRVSDILEEYEF